MRARPGPERDVADVPGKRRTWAQLRGEDRENEYCPFRDGRIIGRDIENQEDVDHHHQDVGAEHSAERTAASSTERCSPDHDGREHLEQHRVSDQRIGRSGLCADEDARQAIAAAAHDEDHELNETRRHADGARRIDVAPDGVDSNAQIGPLEPGPRRQNQDDQQHGLGQEVRNGVAEQEVAQCRRDLAAGLVHDQQGDAL